jgi:hypothetical protein
MLDDAEWLKKLNPSAIDQILLQLAFNTMRVQSYRHGAFLDAAASAAKCTVYLTYLEQSQNLRVTGQLHHIEPKRVKVIVDEVRQALTEGKLMKMLGSQEPRYLIQFPHVWLENFPWQPDKPRIAAITLHREEELRMVQRLPDIRPNAQIINSFQLRNLIAQLYERSQTKFTSEIISPLSDAMADHIERCLLHSGTVAKVEAIDGINFYTLIREYYSPTEQDERIATMMEDTAHYFELLQNWVDRQLQFKRIMEELNIPSNQVNQAIVELDRLIHAWADRYHQPQGMPFVVQMACGLAQPEDAMN